MTTSQLKMEVQLALKAFFTSNTPQEVDNVHSGSGVINTVF
jgi:hypothetical protein